MLPDEYTALLCKMQSSAPAKFASATVASPLPNVRPPFAAKLNPFAAVVEPITAAVFVPQFDPVPVFKLNTCAAAEITEIEQM